MDSKQNELPAEVRETLREAVIESALWEIVQERIDWITAKVAPLWPKPPQHANYIQTVCSTCGKPMSLDTPHRNRVGVMVCSEACTNGDQPPPQPSAFAQKDAEIESESKWAAEYLARAERAEAERDEWQLACANWASTICPKLNAHSLAEAETNLNALLAERDQLRDALTQAKDHIAIATHPELGWAVSEEEHNKVVAERDQLRAEVHGWRLIHSEPDKVVQELNQLRAEVEQWKTTAAKDREENVDMRNEIADLRAQLAELQRINQADYTEAGWQRARELEAQLTVAQEDEKRLDWLAMRWESQSHGPQTVSYTLVQVNGSFRAAIDAARKEARQ